MIIFAGIDGTAAENDADYERTFANSFVKMLSSNRVVSFDDAFYHRGPYTDGGGTSAIARAAFTWVVNKWKLGGIDAVFLGGYSRGAAAVIEVAYWLKPLGIPVECLILFDAVDRSNPAGGGVGGGFWDQYENRAISNNVKHTIHAMRDIPTTGSRITFQRCGQMQEDPFMPHERQHFFTTHGGAGGVPWTYAANPYVDLPSPTIWEFGEANPTMLTPAMDRSGADLVRAWAFPKIQARFTKATTTNPAVPLIPQPAPIPGDQSPIPGGSLPPTAGQRIHIVKSGDWLSKIAITYYGDMNKWKKIYEHNKAVIGSNPDLIKPGQQLVIPL